MIKEAIDLAIESGYAVPVSYNPDERSIEVIFLDPLFWQALGNGLGYPAGITEDGEKMFARSRMHRFIDHLADGKDADSFFAELLAVSKKR